MDKNVAAYLAAIFDVLGSFGICHDRRGQYLLKIQISTHSLSLLNFLLDSVGGNYFARKNGRSKLNFYLWCASLKKIGTILENFIPYMRVQQENAQIALKFLKTIGSPGVKVSIENLVVREDSYKKLKEIRDGIIAYRKTVYKKVKNAVGEAKVEIKGV